MRINPQTHPALYAAATGRPHLPAPLAPGSHPAGNQGEPSAAPLRTAAESAHDAELRRAFESFAGQTLFGQMLRSMRKTLGKPAYFHGGQAEEIFTQQLDQVLSEKLAAASAETLTGPMFELFVASRR